MLTLSGPRGSRPQVEVWLNRVLDRDVRHASATRSRGWVTQEEKPREQWIFDYPAQVRAGWTAALRCGEGRWSSPVLG